MSIVGVTGANGFIGSNLCVALGRARTHEVRPVARGGAPLTEQLRGVDFVVHLAGVNRVAADAEFVEGNVDFTRALCDALDAVESRACVIFASSIHSEGTTPYGRSKRGAEEVLAEFVKRPGRAKAPSAIIYRLPNVFGKWGRPRYNSVVATFAYAIARGEPYEIHEPEKKLPLVYVDDVVREFSQRLSAPTEGGSLTFGHVEPIHEITVGELAHRFESFKAGRSTNRLPPFDDAFTRKLYATYASNLDPKGLTYPLTERSDARGTLAEVIKSDNSGQIFVSVTRPGAVRGGHFHDSKIEKFLVLRGTAAIEFEDVRSHDHWRVTTSGERWEVIDIPPGVAHRIVNVGNDDLVMLFWSSEVFDPERPDTHPAHISNA